MFNISFTQDYNAAIEYLSENSPGTNKPTKLFAWLEPVVDTVAFVYGKKYGVVHDDLLEAIKEYGDLQDN